MNPKNNDDNVFVDTDGTVVMIQWPVLFFTLATSLHRRASANPGNLLATLGSDLVQQIARTTYTVLIDTNYARLFQVFGRRMDARFHHMVYNRKRMELFIGQDHIIMRNPKTNAVLFVRLDRDTDPFKLTVTMRKSSSFKPFFSSDCAQSEHTYHAMNGSEFSGFEFVQEDPSTRFYSTLASFPRDAAALGSLMEAAIPDVTRGSSPRHNTFSVIVRHMQTKYTKLGINVKIKMPAGPNWRNENEIELRHGSDFTVWVEYNEGIVDMTMRPADVFAQNMGAGTDALLTLNHESAQFHGFYERGTQTTNDGINQGNSTNNSGGGNKYYALLTTYDDIKSTGGLRKLIDAVMEIGISKVKNLMVVDKVEAVDPEIGNMETNTPLNPCPHCGVEMGEGGMAGMPCMACERLGRGPV